MFEKFTPEARRAMVLAQEEARQLGHDHIGTDHSLLGLLSEHRGPGAPVLARLGVSPGRLRAFLGRTPDDQAVSGRGGPRRSLFGSRRRSQTGR